MNNTNGWILTDDDSQQYIRPTDNEDIFDCIEMDACRPDKYRVYFAVVDVDSYLECNRAEVRSVLAQARDIGILADDSPIVVNTPDVTALPTSVRNSREMDGITFEARLAGAIHKVTVNGTVYA